MNSAFNAYGTLDATSDIQQELCIATYNQTELSRFKADIRNLFVNTFKISIILIILLKLKRKHKYRYSNIAREFL